MTSILQIIAGLAVMIFQMFDGVAGSTVADQSWRIIKSSGNPGVQVLCSLERE